MIQENPEILANDPYPSDTGLEFSLIGHILCHNAIMPHIGFLQADDFYSIQHLSIFAAMITLHAAGSDITPFTIQPLLSPESLKSFPDGLLQYLASAAAACRAELQPVEIAKHLHGLSKKRRLVVACEDVVNAAKHEHKTVEEYANNLSIVIEKINISSPLNYFQDDYQVGEEILQDLKDCRQPYSTGLSKLDEAMGGGLYPGRAYGFAAKKKVGKTVLAGTISQNLNYAGIKHLFICGEMSPKEIHQRNLARVTDSYPSAFRNGYGETAAFQRKIAEAVRVSPRNVLYRNAPGIVFSELCRVCIAAVERKGVKGIILDYWQLVGGKGKGQSTSEHLDEVAQWIADFSRKHGIWFVMMAQINQEGNTRGGEGIRLAFDQVYHMKAPGDDASRSGRFLEMMDTRYTAWMNIGSEGTPGLYMMEKGPYFSEEPA